MVLTDADKKALQEKMDNPEKEVICPRCGNEIIYEQRGNSIAVECKSPKCIYGGIRGL
jgi:predicted RNA-binding Zn-ribbon protein involved in translation (DUF1610 family)